MFAPFDGVIEDPATGSANCALAGLLSELKEEEEGEFSWKIAQGVEMGRPSTLFARAKKVGGETVTTRIGKRSVLIFRCWSIFNPQGSTWVKTTIEREGCLP